MSDGKSLSLSPREICLEYGNSTPLEGISPLAERFTWSPPFQLLSNGYAEGCPLGPGYRLRVLLRISPRDVRGIGVPHRLHHFANKPLQAMGSPDG